MRTIRVTHQLRDTDAHVLRERDLARARRDAERSEETERMRRIAAATSRRERAAINRQHPPAPRSRANTPAPVPTTDPTPSTPETGAERPADDGLVSLEEAARLAAARRRLSKF